MNERTPGKVDVASEPIPEPATARIPEKVEQQAVAVTETPELIPATKPRRKARGLSWGKAFFVAAGAFAVWLAADMFLTLQQLFTSQPLIAGGLTAVSVVAITALGGMVFKELRAAKQVDHTERRQQQLQQAVATNDVDGMLVLLAPLLESLPENQQQQFMTEAKRRADAASAKQLAENTWLAQCDARADKLINRASLTVAGAVAVVPHPVFDGAVVLWRAVRLVKDIGEVYGLAPTGLSSWRLFKHALVSAVMSAGIETAGDVVLEEFGRGAFESAGKRVAEGAVMMLRMKRLGAQAKAMCRPWPAPAD